MDIVVPENVFWCAHCGRMFSATDEGQRSMTLHLRDDHPDVWEDDFELREWADWEYGVR